MFDIKKHVLVQAGRGAQAATSQQSLEGGVTELLSSTDTNKFTINEKQACFFPCHCKSIPLIICACVAGSDSSMHFGAWRQKSHLCQEIGNAIYEIWYIAGANLVLVEIELTSIAFLQLLEINRRVHKQNNVPPEFPLFVRNGFNIKVVADGYETAPSGLIYKVEDPSGFIKCRSTISHPSQ